MAWKGGKSVKQSGFVPTSIPDGAIEARHISSVNVSALVGSTSADMLGGTGLDSESEHRLSAASSAAQYAATGPLEGGRLVNSTVANQALSGEVQAQLARNAATSGLQVSPDRAEFGRQWTFPFFGLTTKDVTGALAISATDQASVYICNGSGGYSVVLPPVADSKDRVLVFKRFTTSSNVTIDGNGSETIDGATTKVLAADYTSIIIVCDGDEWHIISGYTP
jgi:hypothetical protein